MICPFNCLFFSPGRDPERHDLLIAASGSSICSFDLFSEQLLSVWPPQQHDAISFDATPEAADEVTQKPPNCLPDSESTDRQVKRQKTSFSGEDLEISSTEIVSESAENETLISQHITTSRSPVIKITGTSNGQYIIAVTEDKYIRVLELLSDGTLAQLSERQ